MNRQTTLGRLLGELGRTALSDWVRRSANAVTAYFGRFPIAHAPVHITISQHARPSNGVSFGVGGAILAPFLTATDKFRRRAVRVGRERHLSGDVNMKVRPIW